MPLEIASNPPASIIQGDTLQWRLTSRDASPSDAGLRVRISSAFHTLEVIGVAESDGWLVTVTADQTKRLGDGLLRWMARATFAAGVVRTIDAGMLTAVALAELGTGSSTQSHAARMVALLEAQLEKLASDSLDQYSVGERSATRRKMAEVDAALNAARRRLAMEQHGGRLPRVSIQPRPMVGYRPIT